MADNSRFGFKNMGHMSASGRRRGAFRRQSGEGQVQGFATGEALAVFSDPENGGVSALLDWLAQQAG